MTENCPGSPIDDRDGAERHLRVVAPCECSVPSQSSSASAAGGLPLLRTAMSASRSRQVVWIRQAPARPRRSSERKTRQALPTVANLRESVE